MALVNNPRCTTGERTCPCHEIIGQLCLTDAATIFRAFAQYGPELYCAVDSLDRATGTCGNPHAPRRKSGTGHINRTRCPRRSLDAFAECSSEPLRRSCGKALPHVVKDIVTPRLVRC